MPSLVAYALRREDADRLAEAINRVLISEDRRGRVTSFAPSRPLKAHRDIDPLPALLRVSAWPRGYEILWQGPTLPPEELVRQWVAIYEKNADIQAREEASRLEFERLRGQAPRTHEEAVERLADQLTLTQRQHLAAMAENDLGKLHFSYGMYIRSLWLWKNPALVAACGTAHADDASAVLIRALWRKVRAELDRA
jgi:hypothetical protein